MILGGLKARLRGKRLIGGVASESVDMLRKVVDLAAVGDFRPVIDRSFDFSQMIAAPAHVDTGHKKGNVVVTVNPNSKSKLGADEAPQLAEKAYV
jgi:NADPH:quinone reductase-like Zn-dependent oxidoreductase